MASTVEQACPGDHEVFDAPIDLDLSGGQRVEPDLIVGPRWQRGREAPQT